MDSLLQYESDSSESEKVCDEEVDLKSAKDLGASLVENSDCCTDYFNLQLANSEISDLNKIKYDLKAKPDPYIEWTISGLDRNSYESEWQKPKNYDSWQELDVSMYNSREKMQRIRTNPIKKSFTNDNIVVVPYKSKRRLLETKLDDKTDSSKVCGSGPRLLLEKESSTCSKSFFVIHSKIQPYLFSNNGVQNKVPQKVTKQLSGHMGAVNRVKWCARQFSHLLLSVSMDRTAKIWNIFSAALDPCVRTVSCHWKSVKDGDWSASGREIVTCGFDCTVRVSDVEKGAEVYKCDFDDFVTCVKYHPVQQNIFLAGSLNLLKCWDVRCSGKSIRTYTYKDKIGQVHDLCFLDNGDTFLSCGSLVARDSADRNIMIWDFRGGAVISNQIYHERYVCTRFCKHPHSPQFIAQTHGDYIVQFDAFPPYRMNKCKRYEGHKVFGYDIGCDISPDGRFVATGSTMGEMLFYDYRSAKMISKQSTTDTGDIILNVVWHPVLYSTVAIGSWNGVIEIWQ